MSYSDDREPATETSQNKPVFLVKVQEKTENSGKHEVDLLLDAFNCNTLFSSSVTHSYLCILETASSESDIQRGANEKLSRINGSTQRG